MAKKENYYIAIDGQAYEVSQEVYETYYKGKRKERYFSQDLKQERTKVDKKQVRLPCSLVEKIPMRDF